MHAKIQQDTVGGWYLCYIFLCVTDNLLIDTYGPVFSLFLSVSRKWPKSRFDKNLSNIIL